MSIKIVIVEDLDEVREGLNNFISLSPDFKVLDCFKTAEEALYAVPELGPDIVIMDINLPRAFVYRVSPWSGGDRRAVSGGAG
jgi:DNA-binding NarL/FixJ family response regulator